MIHYRVDTTIQRESDGRIDELPGVSFSTEQRAMEFFVNAIGRPSTVSATITHVVEERIAVTRFVNE